MRISIKNLNKSYPDKNVFDNFSLDMELDGITVLMGDSGRGKTTLIRVIAGLEKYNGGEINGVPEKISFMFQEDRLIPWLTAKENISCVSDDEKADIYLEKMLLSDEGNKQVAELSGGMKRRIALARALAYTSELVILDEPFKGLDYELKKKIIEVISEESQNRPFLIVTHDKDEAEILNAKIIII